MTLICATITDIHDLKQAKDDGAQAFEFRLDYCKDLLEKKNPTKEDFAFLNQKEPVIVTCRNNSKNSTVSNEQKRAIFQLAIDAGADYVDIEDDSPLLGEFKGKTICSHHNFNETPESSDIVSIMRNLNKYGVPKAAFMVHEAVDLKNISDAAKILKTEMETFIIIGMGIPGEITRVAANTLGSLFTYCSINKNKATAPGQLTVKEAVSLDKNPIITGIIGWPLTHTFSPAIQNAAFASVGLAGRYVRIPVHPNNIKLVPELMSDYMITGLNVTIPHKETILSILTKKTETVERIGSSNTITKDCLGDNTDIKGIAATLDPYVHENSKILLIGAGGAARAVAWYAQLRGCHLTIANRTEEKAKLLAAEFNAEVLPLTKINGNYDAIINATPIDPPDIAIPNKTVVMDLRYPSSLFLEKARKSGVSHVFSGETMLIYQGIASFEIWTGKRPEMKKIEEAFKGAKDD